MSSSPLPLGYSDPHAYIDRDRFHQTAVFRATFLPPTAPLQRVSFASAGDPSGPLLVFSTTTPPFPPGLFALISLLPPSTVGGLGFTCLEAIPLDALATSHSVHLLALDRPSSGASTPTDLPHRVQWAHEALLAILHLSPPSKTFSILSHSNGLVYALYTLRHLPGHLRVRCWTMTSPWLPPGRSGAKVLALTSLLPSFAIRRFGGVVNVVDDTTDLWERAKVVVGKCCPGGHRREAGPSLLDAAGQLGFRDEARIELEGERQRNANRRPEDVEFVWEHCSFACRYYLMWKLARKEGRKHWGEEALLALRRGKGGRAWGCGDARVEGKERGGAREGVYEWGFRGIEERMGESGKCPPRVRVVWGERDEMVPEKGRRYLHDVLRGLIAEGDWVELPRKGHDEVLYLSHVIGPVFEEAQKLL